MREDGLDGGRRSLVDGPLAKIVDEIRISVGSEEHPHTISEVVRAGDHERREALAVCKVDVDPDRDQVLNDLRMSVSQSHKKRCFSVPVSDVEQASAVYNDPEDVERPVFAKVINRGPPD